jgi:hypothetical protein
MISNTLILIASVLIILINLGFFSTSSVNSMSVYNDYGVHNLYFYISRNLATIMLVGVMLYIVMF